VTRILRMRRGMTLFRDADLADGLSRRSFELIGLPALTSGACMLCIEPGMGTSFYQPESGE